jgi:Icc-related predicted phosphoesterase
MASLRHLTHGHHNLLQIPTCDMVIFSGDESNFKNPYDNLKEFNNFITWYSELPITYKIFVAGNHSAAIAKGLIKKQDFIDKGIIYLENDYTDIKGLKIFGSPITPTFNDWYFMKSRDKLDRFWSNVELVDIIITHGPPKYILDLSENKQHILEFCGDKALHKHVVNRIKPVLHCFGHIHNFKNIKNSGVKKIIDCNTIFSNGAVVEDGKFGDLIGNGNLFEIDLLTKKVNVI